MKRTIIISSVFIFLLLSIFAFIKTSKKDSLKMTGETGFAIIELFTSEGCSSCPPADDAVAQIQKKYADKNVLVLGYHVDYWDRLGWKDPFSSADFTSRQNYYADIFKLSSIYTPEVVVNGQEEFVGSDKNKLISTVEEQLKENTSSAIKIKAAQNTAGKIEITYSTQGNYSKQEELVLLLVQKTATNNIKKGENEGRTLHHINIVRKFSSFDMPSKEETTTFNLPTGLKKEDVFIAAFIQNKKSGKISGIQSAQIN